MVIRQRRLVNNRVIRKVKRMKPWVRFQSLEFMRTNTKLSKLFSMFISSYIKVDVGLIKNGFLACPTKMGASS